MADDPAATRYHRLQLVLAIASLGVALGYLLAVLATGGGHALARWSARRTDAWWGQTLLVALALGIGHAVVSVPLAWVRGYWLPRRYGLLHQSPASWLGDRLKAAAISAPLALGGVLLIYALLRVTPLWWLPAAAIFLVVYVVMATVLPVWILPLFYRLTPLEDAALRARLLALAERAGVRAVGVWVADQSRKSRTANAAVVGLGRTRRIILFDTLLAEFTPDEIEAVLAHELGHHVHGDTRRGLLVQGVLTLATFWAADVLLRAGVSLWGSASPADPAGVPWLALVLTVLGLIAAPLGNGFSRWIERQADDFALATTGNVGAFVGAMERLGRLNLAERRPHRLKEIVLYSHPSLERRIARARERAA